MIATVCEALARIIPAYAGSTSRRCSGSSPASDHPRIRGEHFSKPGLDVSQAGSSPHTRGAHRHVQAVFFVNRIIPAYAGSTPSTSGQIGGDADHPRIRGEHHTALKTTILAFGSSPHTRGAPAHVWRACATPRIIPAYAGSTQRWHLRRIRSPDHPRIRGEHSLDREAGRRAERIIPAYAGSTPRVSRMNLLSEWIIPAYAGSTRFVVVVDVAIADHPRIRGEHRPVIFVTAGMSGSSPHTRGAQAGPAGSGCFDEDHPRIRGEHHRRPAVTRIVEGSSPHTRGAPSVRLPATVVVGDHPRIRGEHRRDRGARIRQVGSSPHTRGALQVCPDPVVDEGIIPAYAGSTSKTPKNRSAPRDHPRIRGEH